MSYSRLFLTFGTCNCIGQKPGATLSVDLIKARAPAKPRAIDWVTFVNRIIWIDNENVVAWLASSCFTRENRNSSDELIFVNLNGRTRSLRLDNLFALSRGPAGTVLVDRGHVVDLLDSNLRTVQTIECPKQNPCSLFTPSLVSESSDFAICSQDNSMETCDFYKGLPAAPLTERQTSFSMLGGTTLQSPYADSVLPETAKVSPYSRSAWRVSNSELWYFDDHMVLTSLRNGASAVSVTQEKWTPKAGNCIGDLFVSEPRRFLATCVGAHVWTDGEFDAIFGYSRIAHFDVTSHRILRRINGPEDISAVLSPNGKVIATTHPGKMKIYRVE